MTGVQTCALPICQPFQLTPRTVGRLGEALAYRRRVDGMLGDIGFELSGPLKKDKVWFYIGFAPTVTQYQTDRVLRRASYDPAIQGARRDTGYECPSYLSDPALCRGAQALAIAMEETDSQRFTELRTLYNGIAKLQFNLSPDHNLTLSYIASPKTFSGSYLLGLNQTGMIDDGAYTQTDQVHDATLRYVGKLLSRKLQLSAMYGFHFQGINVAPKQIDKPLQIYLSESTDPYSLADFEDVSGCRRQMQPDGMGGALSFNPCPITTYRRGGFGQYNRTDLQRHQLLLAATYFLDALGTHAIKLGFDFEHLRNKNFRAYTGPGGDPTDGLSANGVYRTSADGQALLATLRAQKDTIIAAYEARDRTFFEQLLASDFRGMDPTGTVLDKASYLDLEFGPGRAGSVTSKTEPQISRRSAPAIHW